MQLIDIHPHVISDQVERYPLAPLLGKRSEWSQDHAVTVESLLTSMDRAGIDKAALVHSSTTYGFDCSYTADAVSVCPSRLTGVFSVDVLAPDAVQKMEHWLARGMSGMRIFASGTTMSQAWLSLNDPRIDACYRLAIERGLSVASNIDDFDEVDRLLTRFPDLIFLLDHAGRADFTDGPPFAAAEGLFNLARHRNLHLKLTGRTFNLIHKGKSSPETVLPALVAAFGSERLAWGSNYPASKGTLEERAQTFLDAVSCLTLADQQRIAHGTALKLFPSLADEGSA